jgi:hypothetical protein
MKRTREEKDMVVNKTKHWRYFKQTCESGLEGTFRELERSENLKGEH